MAKKISDFFSGWKMTLVSGVFLGISLIFVLMGKRLPVDPAWVTVGISGFPLLYLAITRLVFQKWVSSALLISMAMAASISIGEYFAAGEVAFIMAIGAILEDLTVNRAKKGLSNLIALAPEQGRKLIPSDKVFKITMIPAKEIQRGDWLRVLPGERIPVDGRILTGSTSVDQSILTGESLPVDKAIEDEVFCGTLNCYGTIDIEAQRVGEDSSLQKMIQLVKEAEDKKAPMQRIADRWAVWLVPIALMIAVGGFIVNWVMGYGLMTALRRGVTVLVVFCPCALALATPTSIMAAIGQAAKQGVIIKSGEALERMGNADTIAFDKTGTLTWGSLEVSDVILISKAMSKQQLLSLAVSLEMKSEHPLGKAIVEYGMTLGVEPEESSGFLMVAGKGVSAWINGRKICCGSEGYLESCGIAVPPEACEILTKLRTEGKASIVAAADGICIGIIALSDRMRPEAREMIEELSALGTRTVLLTGDNQRTAGYVAKQAGITAVHAGLMPEEKVENITSMQRQGANVCMIGDGVNDAPALKTADVGVAMGSMGSDIAVDAADIALMSDDISRIPYLKRLSNAALRTIKGNIGASMCINGVAVALSILGVLNPITGALVHNAGSLLVVLNAALLYDRKF